MVVVVKTCFVEDDHIMVRMSRNVKVCECLSSGW